MRCILLPACLTAVAILHSHSSWAQVTPDGTLNTSVTTIGNNATITNGTAAGSNLFHSFGQFSIPTGGSATFNLVNTPNVSTIFSRVTGGNFSNIDGLIQTVNSSNPVSLFLINPAGILFGPNASLNIGGSFVGTTASSIKFANGAELASTATPLPTPLLTVSAPIGLQMGPNPGAIINQSAFFALAPGQTLALIGGDLALQGNPAVGYAYLFAPDGHIELGSVEGNSLVSLTPSALGWAFGYDTVNTFRDISLTQSAFIDVSGAGGGTIDLQGNKIQFTNGAGAYGVTFGAVSGGGITVQARESLSIVGPDVTNSYPSGIFEQVFFGATGNGGNITLTTPYLSVTDGGQIGLTNYGQGNLGAMTIQAGRIEVIGTNATVTAPSLIYSQNTQSSQGRGGDLTLNTQALVVAQGGQIVTGTRSTGQGGNLTIRANTIQGFNPQPLSSQFSVIGASTTGSGNAGTLDIITQQLSLTGAVQITASTAGAGNGGKLTIQATDIYADRGTYAGPNAVGISASAGQGDTGNAGTVEVQTQRLTLLNGAQVGSGTSGSGNGGKVTIKADEITAIGIGLESLSGGTASGIVAGTNPTSTGNAGDIEIDTRRLNLSAGAQVNSSITGRGNGGSVIIRASDLLVTGTAANSDPTGEPVPAGILAAVEPTGRGKSGNIDITSDRVRVEAGAKIASSTNGLGNAGTVKIQALESIQVDSLGRIQGGVGSNGVGEGGRIDLATQQLQLTNQGTIAVLTSGQGNAGNITIQANQVSLLDKSEIIGQSFSDSDAGTITVTSNALTLRNDSLINATTAGAGNGGTINLNLTTLDLDTNSSLSSAASSTGKAGNLNLQVDRTTLLNNSQITSRSTGSGNGGIVTLTGAALALRSGASITATTAGAGNGGTINLNLTTLDLNTNASLSSAASSTGKAGNLNLQVDRTTLLNNSQITTRSTGTGDGGIVNLRGDTLTVRNGSSLNASTASGNGGNLNLNLSGLLYLRNLSQLTAEAGGNGNGGNININALFVVGWGNSDIIANAFRGNGGNIQIATQGIFGLKFRPQLTPKNDITASSRFGVNGSVQIQVLAVDPSNGLTELSEDLIDPSRQIAAGCTSKDSSSFVITGRGGIPENPMQPLRRDRTWADTRSLSEFRTLPPASQPTVTSTVLTPPAIVEASILRQVNGQLELVAVNSPAPRSQTATCAGAIGAVPYSRSRLHQPH
jgi:filamentous hemagglutinin family protein